jgi:hypothetical protein
MCENYCFLCQEPKIVVGHVTQFCPNVECKKCGLKGHVRENCPSLNFIMDQKPDCNVIVLNNDAKILDFVKNIEFSNDIKPKFEVQEENLKINIESSDDKKTKLEIKEESLDINIEVSENSSVMHNDIKILDFVKDIEFSNDIKPKFEVKEEKLKIKTS